MYKKFTRLLLVALFSPLLISCSSLGSTSASSTNTRSTNTQSNPLSTLQSPQGEVKRGVSSEANRPEVSARALADMRALASESNQSVYLIGASDLLEIKVFQAEELSRQVRVDQRGNITLPLLGNIRVAGLSKDNAERRLAELMGKDLLRNPQVSVFIKEFTAQRVTVEGEVKKQGVYPLNGQVSILQAVAMAGGLTEFAAVSDVILFRNQGSRSRGYNVDLNAIRNGLANDPFLKNDDRIVIKKLEKKRVTVDGEVKKSGVFPFKEPITVMQAIALAQGLSNLAAPDKVVVFRRENGTEKAYSVNLTNIRKGIEPDPYVKNDDRIVVQRSNSRFWVKELAPLVSPLTIFTGIFR